MDVEIDFDRFLEILYTGGVSAWNRWFMTHPKAWPENHSWSSGTPKPDGLIHVDLQGADLSGMNLDGIFLNGADLRRTKFHQTSLRCARIVCANAAGASFAGADMRGADLFLTSIDDADFSDALLDNSNVFYLAFENKNTCFRNAKMYVHLYDLVRKGDIAFRNGRALNAIQPRDERLN